MATSKNRKRAQTKKRGKTVTQIAKAERKQLRELGLISKKTKLNRAISASDKRAIKKFRDVLDKKATVVTLDKKAARGYRGKLRVVGNKAVVPKRKGERISVDKKTQEITTTRKVAGKTIKRRLKKRGDVLQTRRRKGKRQWYTITMARGTTEEIFRFSSMRELENFMSRDSIRNFKNWMDYVEVEEMDDEDYEGED